jgi:hypothetical protein
MRRALIVGVDFYKAGGSLYGCVNDSFAVKAMLDVHADASFNFHVVHLTGTGPNDPVNRRELRAAIVQLFEGKGEVSLLYFAGHGHIEPTGGYICASDSQDGNDGVPLSDIVTLANNSQVTNRVIILDSCHSGVAGGAALKQSVSEINDGVTILTASTAEQYATEENGAGVFTTLLVDALGGAASNLVGDITPGGVYAHIDQSLGGFGQRPVFKTNVQSFVSLRKVRPPIEISELRRISEFFPNPGYEFQLDPTFEPERPGTHPLPVLDVPGPDPVNNAIFAILQKYKGNGLLVPNSEPPHMWHAAMNSKTVRLTALGEHYRRLAAKKKI